MNDRIRNAYRGALLTAEDIAEMSRLVTADNVEWKRRKSRIENVGEVLEGVRKRNQSKGRKAKHDNLVGRDLTEEDKGRLLRSWA